jgi:sigma-B regulation protein RsbU (phosphoserine phosphatase)
MFTTLRSKLIFFLTLILLITAAVVMYLTHQDVGLAIRNAEKASARNVLKLVELNIREEYDKLLAEKIQTVLHRRQQLRNLSEIAVASVDRYIELVRSTALAADRLEPALVGWFNAVKPQAGKEWFLFDGDGTVIAHPEPDMRGTSLALLDDMKGRQIARVMRYDALTPRGDFAVYRMPGENGGEGKKKMGYFHALIDQQWTLGVAIDISDIEAEAEKRLTGIIASLKETFSGITIAQSGSAFLFTGDRRMLVPPTGHKGYRFSSGGPAATGLMQRIMDTVAAGKDALVYAASPAAPSGKDIQGYVRYFKALDWYMVVCVPVAEIQAPARKLITRQMMLISLIFVGSLIVSFLLVAGISRPLNLLAAYAKTIPENDFTTEVATGSAIASLPDRYRDEVGRLAESIVYMEAELASNIRQLMETTAAKERILGELNVARQIQMGILPKTFPAFPDCESLDLYAYLEPAKSVGGDLYDFFFVDDRHLCFTVGDVSDKGVPAAMFMVITRTLIKMTALRGLSPAEMMSQVNNVLGEDNPNCMFVTLFIGMLDIATGEVRYANGGHNPPVMMRRGLKPMYHKGLSGPVVGALEEVPYKELSLHLDPGDALFLYTDGVTEAMDTDSRLYSDEKLIEVLTETNETEVDAVIEVVRHSVTAHAGDAPQSDDITMLMLRYLGSRENGA